jgi:hypothetical protein
MLIFPSSLLVIGYPSTGFEHTHLCIIFHYGGKLDFFYHHLHVPLLNVVLLVYLLSNLQKL